LRWCANRIADAVSSAALHAAKNATNTKVIRDCIEGRVQDILSSPVPIAPRDIIARIHALFIYQIIRQFDTDPRVRHSYDATIQDLEEAAYSLIPYIVFHEYGGPGQTNDAPDVLPLYPISAASEFWGLWVFQESARRTLAIVSFFVLAHYYMKGEPGRCASNAHVSRSVTLSAHLWRAGDPVEFALAWRNKRHYVVHGKA